MLIVPPIMDKERKNIFILWLLIATVLLGFLFILPDVADAQVYNPAWVRSEDLNYNSGTISVGGSFGWTDSSNVEDNDSTYATSGIGIGGYDTHYIYVDNLGFDLPNNATIEGIEIQMHAKSQFSTGGSEKNAQLLKYGSPVGDIDTGNISLTSSRSKYLLGADDDLWGETWTVNQIESADFGFRTQFTCPSTCQIDLDYIWVKVYYSVEGDVTPIVVEVSGGSTTTGSDNDLLYQGITLMLIVFFGFLFFFRDKRRGL